MKVRAGVMSHITKVDGIQGIDWKFAKDAGGALAFGNEIHRFGGTDNAQGVGNNSVFNDGYKSIDGGRTFTHYTAPWVRRNEMCCAQSETKNSTPRGYMWGGNGTTVGENPSDGAFNGTRWYADSWYCDSTGWHQITSTMTGFEGMGFAYEGFLSEDGYFYTFAGESVTDNISTGQIIKSSDLINWTPHSMLPESLRGWGRFAACEWKGVWLLAGGYDQQNQFWVSRDKGQTWALRDKNQNLYDNRWPELKACKNFAVYRRGTDENNPIGLTGSYYIDDIDTLQLKRLPYEMEGTHASNMFESADKESVFACDGNMHTTLWKVYKL